MGLFFVYILKSSVCLAVFYLFYRLLLSRETFHRFNRFALLGILALSCLLPLVEVSVHEQTEVHQTMMTLEEWLLLADAMNSAEAEIQAQDITVTWIQVALLLYLLGIFFFISRNIYSLVRLLMLLKSGSREKVSKFLPDRKCVTLIVHDSDIAPFSWMKYVVISRKDLEENGREILIHELAHIRNRHSVDLLVADICIFFQWFNPASWLLKQELQNIHEYEADETVIKEGVDARQYQLLLIKKAVGTRLYSMANSFNHSKLKKRITMMLKEKSSPWARMKYLYILPVTAIAVTAFARPEISDTTKEISAVKVNDLAAIVETKVTESVNVLPEASKEVPLAADTTKPVEVKYIPKEVKDRLSGTPVLEGKEDMPEFPGGMSALMQYFRKNMRYPEAAKKRGTQGRVVVRFVVGKDGSVRNPKVLRPVDEELDAEAIRLVKAMPKWKPGMEGGQAVDAKFTVPVKFSLDDGQSGDSADGMAEEGVAVGNGKEPLYVVDGKEVSPSVMSALNPERIKGVTVLKDKSATELYGEKGKNGVILITLEQETPGIVLGQSISVDKEAGTNGEIHIAAKKSKDAEKTAVQGTVKVEGKVIDEKGNPVIGAIVLVEGTDMGAVTDLDGNFILSVPSKEDILVVSYVGMATVKVKVQSKVTVTLKNE